MQSQLLAARLALFALFLGAAAAVGAVIAVRLGLLPYAGGLTAMTGATVLGVLALVLALVWLFKALTRNDGAAKRIGLIALLGSMVFLYVPLSNLARELSSPAINDVSSDPDAPPRFVALAKLRQPGMNSPEPDSNRRVHFKGETNTAAYMLHTYYGSTSPNPITKPHGYLMKTRAAMFWHAFETVKKLGWTIIDYSQGQGRIEAVDTSFWFGQKIDIVIGVETAGTIGSRINARAQSEIGSRDFGGNLVRLEKFFTAFKGGGF